MLRESLVLFLIFKIVAKVFYFTLLKMIMLIDKVNCRYKTITDLYI